MRAPWAAVALLSASPAAAQSDRATALEARLNALEAEVRSLRAELAATRPPAPAAPASATISAVPLAQAVPDHRLAAAATPKDGFRVGGTTFRIGGYVKVDFIGSDFSGGDPLADAIVNNYYIPAQIPVGGRSEGFDLTTSVRETRTILQSETPVGEGVIKGLVEVDFLDTPQLGNQRVSNSFVPRVRRAYLNYGGLTIGQDWSTFQNSAALPERIDFIGPTDGTVFERQPLIRYRHGKFTVAVENPETTLTVGATSSTADDDYAPDVVLRYDESWHGGSLALAVIGRALHAERFPAPAGFGIVEVNGDAFGWGASLSGVQDNGASRISWMVTVGEGIGRYLGLNIRDDAIARPGGGLQAPLSYSGFVSYRYAFAQDWKAIATLSGFQSEAPSYTSRLLTSSVWSANGDLLYNPFKPLTFGIGFRYGERTLLNGDSGALRRVQFSARFDY